MSLSLNFPTIRPTLNLDFASVGMLDPRVTFTRASTATYFNSLGVLTTAQNNEARFDYNPTTGAARGLLIEEQRTNLEPNSEALTSVIGASILNNVTTAPSGLVTADKLVEDTSTGGHQVNTISIVWVGNTAYTFTIFLKADTRTQVNLAFGTAGNWVGSQRSAQFDLSNGTVIGTGGANVTASIEAVGNGWYRCRITCTTIATPVPSTVQTQMWVGGSATYTGDGTSGLFFWGAQVEVGSFPTSYIPTSGTTLTRNADVASMTGTNFSSWYNASEGTVVTQATGPLANVFKVLMEGATVSDFKDFTLAFDGLRGNFTNRLVTGNYDVVGPTNSLTAGATVKLAGSYTSTSADMAYNGLLATTKNAATQRISADRMFIGSRLGTSLHVNGYIQRIAYYPTRLTNAQLQALTL